MVVLDPVFDYPNEGSNGSIIGGYVYRAQKHEQLRGSYVYGDFCSGNIWADNPQSKKNTLILKSGFNISSFGQDEAGEIYVLDHSSGNISQLD
jgi:hypothetical protein